MVQANVSDRPTLAGNFVAIVWWWTGGKLAWSWRLVYLNAHPPQVDRLERVEVNSVRFVESLLSVRGNELVDQVRPDRKL